MKKISVSILSLVLMAVPAAAQTIDALGAAGAIAGTENVPVFQTANPAKKTTAAEIGNSGTLTGDCAKSAGATAATCKPGHPGYKVNGYYPPLGIPGDGSGSVVAANTIYCSYGMIADKITISRLGVRIATAGSTNLQLAIYANNGGDPGVLLSNTGNIANTAAATVVDGALGASKQVGPGGSDAGRDVFFCFNNGDATANFNAIASNSILAAAFIGTQTLANIMGSSAVTVVAKSCAGANCNGGSSTLGTWPATLAGSTWSDVTSQIMPVIFFRVASVP